MSGKGFLGNMAENLQADCVESRKAGFILCFRKEEVGICPHGTGRIHMKMSGVNRLLRRNRTRSVLYPKRRTRPRCNFQR